MRHKTYFGAFLLFLSGIICKILGAFFRLPLTNILGAEGIGYFQMIMALFGFALTVVSGGTSVVLSKNISECLARGNNRKIQAYFACSIITVLAFSAVFGLGFALLSGTISAIQGFDATNVYGMFFALLFFGGVCVCFRGVFQGYENMLPSALSSVIEQLFKFVLGLCLANIFCKKSVEFGVFGAFLGVLFGEIFAFLVLFVFWRKKFGQFRYKICAISYVKKQYLKDSVFVAGSASFTAFAHAVDSILIVLFITHSGISKSTAQGLYGLSCGIVGALLNFPLVISTALAGAFLPNISKSGKNTNLQLNNISNAFFVLVYFVLPTAFGLFAISPIAYKVIYPNLTDVYYSTAINLTFLGAMNVVLLAISQFFVMLLQARGNFLYILVCYILCSALKILCTLLALISSINIYAITIGNLVFSAVLFVVTYVKVRKLFAFNKKSLPCIIAFLCAVFMAVATFKICQNLLSSSVLHLIIALVFGALLYFLLTFYMLYCLKDDFFAKTKLR